MQNIIERLTWGVFVRLRIASIVLMLGITACGESSRSSIDASRLQDQTSPLVGTWAKQLVFSSEASAMGVVSRSKIERLVLARVSLSDEGLKAIEQPCDITSLSSRNTKVVFPDALKRSLPLRVVNYAIEENSGVASLRSNEGVEILGARLEHPSTDPLPTKSDDVRVLDQDGDGNPGVTVEVSSRAVLVTIRGKVYLTQRTSVVESGVFVDSDKITGQLQWSGEQHTLGSDSTVLARISPSVTPLSAESGFTMRKIREESTCETLLAEYDQLFTRPVL